jgi:isochorismate synthase
VIDQLLAGPIGLRPAVETARARARALGRPVLVSRTDPLPASDPIDLFARGARLGPDRACWVRPDEGLSLVGLGVAWAVEAGGADRFRTAARAWTALVADAVDGGWVAGARDREAAAEAGPLLLGGFAFDPSRPATELWRGFPAARLALPRLLMTRRGDRGWLTTSLLVEAATDPDAAIAALERDLAALREPLAPAADPQADRAPRVADALPAEQWRAIVAEATAAIERAEAEKIVLARAVRVEARRPFDLPAALRRLRAAYPTCAIFALANQAGCFLGATPERLVRLIDGEVQVSCLAGTVARGRTAEEDDRLGAELLASDKNRQEHTLVVQELTEQLAGGVVDLEVPPEPALMRVRNVQHLHTPLRGRLAAGGSLLELAARVHPTPAVGGRPRAPALTFIRENERLDRGWYAGPVGWVDAGGDGELVVALRSALVPSDAGLPGRVATLFAGCGIVAGSDPAAEYAESVLKLQPMLAALGGA